LCLGRQNRDARARARVEGGRVRFCSPVHAHNPAKAYASIRHPQGARLTSLFPDGASLIYTTPSAPSSLQSLIHTMLSIQSPLRVRTRAMRNVSPTNIPSLHQHETLKHNVIERDKVLVPPHWDSWGKIRVLREGFDVEGIHTGWSADISPSLPDSEPSSEGGAVEVYEDVIKDTKRTAADSLALLKGARGGMEVGPVDTQDYLATQFEVLEAKAAEEKANSRGSASAKEDARRTKELEERAERVMEQVGPVQFNVGGIQVDAENMLESLKVPPRRPHAPHSLSKPCTHSR